MKKLITIICVLGFCVNAYCETFLKEDDKIYSMTKTEITLEEYEGIKARLEEQLGFIQAMLDSNQAKLAEVEGKIVKIKELE